MRWHMTAVFVRQAQFALPTNLSYSVNGYLDLRTDGLEDLLKREGFEGWQFIVGFLSAPVLHPL